MVSKYATFCPEIEIVQKMSTFAIKTFETFDGSRPRNKLTCRKIGSDLSFLEERLFVIPLFLLILQKKRRTLFAF